MAKSQRGTSASLSPEAYPLRAALDAADRPLEYASQAEKKNYAERLSRLIATRIAGALRPDFDGITPDAQGGHQESRARTSKGVKKLDVNYSTPELGLGLGVSVKTINFRDSKSKRYTKNYTRVDNELRAEAMDYHLRQPYAVLIAVVFLPSDSCDDGKYSSFGKAVQLFRHRALRIKPKDEEELFEGVFVGIYEHSGENRGEVFFFNVANSPPRRGQPKAMLDFNQLIAAIRATYDQRNKPPFDWAE